MGETSRWSRLFPKAPEAELGQVVQKRLELVCAFGSERRRKGGPRNALGNGLLNVVVRRRAAGGADHDFACRCGRGRHAHDLSRSVYLVALSRAFSTGYLRPFHFELLRYSCGQIDAEEQRKVRAMNEDIRELLLDAMELLGSSGTSRSGAQRKIS